MEETQYSYENGKIRREAILDSPRTGTLSLPVNTNGFIRLFEKHNRVSVFVTDIEILAKLCQEHMGKTLLWENGSLLYFYHLKLIDDGNPKEFSLESDMGQNVLQIANESRQAKF